MVIECPKCHTTYRFTEEQENSGAKVRCAVCEYVFEPGSNTVGDEVQEAPEGTPVKTDVEKDRAFEEKFSTEKDTKSSLDIGATEIPPAKSNKTTVLLLTLILLVLVAGFGTYFLAPQFFPSSLFPFIESSETQKQEESAAVMQERIKSISLEDVRQYYVDNEKTGRIFVVEGRALNNGESAVELIKVEASLFDVQNTSLETNSFLCGNTLSLFQLQMLGKEDIISALDDKAGIGSNNVNVRPGQQVPFMAVFFSPSDAVSEFAVRVISVQDVNL